VKQRSLPRRSVERRFNGTRNILGDLFDETLLKESAAGFHDPRCVDVHRILLAMIENQKAAFVDQKPAPIDDPTDLSVHHALYRKRAGKILDDVPLGAAVEHKIGFSKACAIWKDVLDSHIP